MSEDQKLPHQMTPKPPPTLREFLRIVGEHGAADDKALTASTLRAILADIRSHALRLHMELQNAE